MLLDTQCWLWAVNSPDRLNVRAQRLIQDVETELCMSAVCAIEISVKYSAGRLLLHIPPAEFIPALLALGRVTILPIDVSHAVRLASLPFHHRDPFDRLLIAQAQVENLQVLTADSKFEDYDIEVIRAD
jgi:PIN domain nuclease of toxin-antitoxin system